ncbi:MAG TPA: thioesterase family protein [Acidimicrobiia bacterium]|nr:thioesterase family protein [Acidimicrobiia bacterium]
MNFGEASAVTPAGDGVWTAEVQPDWDIFGVSNGGYLMAIGARAMSGSSQGRRPVSLTAHFLRPLSAGPVEVAVARLKTGRTFSTLRATIAATSDSMALLGSFAEPGALRTEDLYVSARPPDLPPPEECPRALPAPDGPLPPPLVGQFEERIHPDDAGPFQGRPSGVGRVRGWFRLHDREPIDAFTLLLVADAFPPAVFNADLPLAWTPTLEMTTQVRAVPAEGWLRCRFSTRFVSGGLLEEDGEIWDESGRLVAISRQLALVPR